MTTARRLKITPFMISVNPYCEAEIMQNTDRTEDRENKVGLHKDFYLQLVTLG